MTNGDHHSSDPELDDTIENPAGVTLPSIDVRAIRHPLVVRAALGVLLSALALLWPGRTQVVVARLLGAALVIFAATAIWTALRSARPLRRVAAASVALGAGGVLTIYPDQSDQVLGQIIGGLLAVVAVRGVVTGLDSANDPASRRWLAARTAAVLGFAALVFIFPSAMLSSAVFLAAAGWFVVSSLVVASSLSSSRAGVANYDDSVELVAAWLASRPKSLDDRNAVHTKLLYEGTARRTRTIRFLTLMTFASVIASMGIVADSTAVVIGAMLIAPLMTPLMAMSLSLVMGWPNRLGWSALIAVTGIVLAIGVAFLLGASVPAIIDTSTNSQILARTSPTMLDLIIALAAGAAGAYGLSRPDVSDALPGVAVAISLVPPLSVVGIAYSQGDIAAGNGALLLFTTNMLAILVMGGATFVITGVAPINRVTSNQYRVRTATAALAALGTVVLGALMLNGAQITADLLDQASAERAVERVLADHDDHDVAAVDVRDRVVVVTIVGPESDAPTARALATELADALDREVTIELRLVVQDLTIATAGGG